MIPPKDHAGIRHYDDGNAEDRECCIYQVFYAGIHQCRKKRGFGQSGLFCQLHKKLEKNLLAREPVDACENGQSEDGKNG